MSRAPMGTTGFDRYVPVRIASRGAINLANQVATKYLANTSSPSLPN